MKIGGCLYKAKDLEAILDAATSNVAGLAFVTNKGSSQKDVEFKVKVAKFAEDGTLKLANVSQPKAKGCNFDGGGVTTCDKVEFEFTDILNENKGKFFSFFNKASLEMLFDTARKVGKKDVMVSGCAVVPSNIDPAYAGSRKLSFNLKLGVPGLENNPVTPRNNEGVPMSYAGDPCPFSWWPPQ